MSSGISQGLPDGGKARRIYLLLRDAIAHGRYASGAALPAEHALAETHSVSRVTIRRALAALAADGIVESRAGSGTVVIARPGGGTVAGDVATLLPQLILMGRTEARLLSFVYQTPGAVVAEALGLTPDQRVQTAQRVRSLDGQPFSHLTTHVPEAIARKYSEADLATTPLLRAAGTRRRADRQRAAVGDGDAGGARCGRGAGHRRGIGAAVADPDRRDADGRGVEYLSALYRPDVFRLDMQLSLVGGSGDRHWEPVIGATAEAARMTARTLFDKLWASHEVLRRDDGASLLVGRPASGARRLAPRVPQDRRAGPAGGGTGADHGGDGSLRADPAPARRRPTSGG